MMQPPRPQSRPIFAAPRPGDGIDVGGARRTPEPESCRVVIEQGAYRASRRVGGIGRVVCVVRVIRVVGVVRVAGKARVGRAVHDGVRPWRSTGDRCSGMAQRLIG